MERSDVEDTTFGTLRWFADGSFYGSEIMLEDGSEFLVSFDVQENELAAMLPQARESLRWVLDRDEHVRRLAAEHYTDTYNHSARDLDDDPEPISPEEFARRIRLAACWFYPDGAVKLTYHDADMFGGHSIHAECDPITGRIKIIR